MGRAAYFCLQGEKKIKIKIREMFSCLIFCVGFRMPTMHQQLDTEMTEGERGRRERRERERESRGRERERERGRGREGGRERERAKKER